MLKAGEGVALTAAETEFFKSVSGNREPPTASMREQWWICGRRAGKDSVASLVAAYSRPCGGPLPRLLGFAWLVITASGFTAGDY